DFSDGPSWSPDGKKLIYSSTLNNSGWLTFISDITTGASQQFSAIPENATDPAWSPDGTHIVYDAYTDPSQQIRDLYLVNVDGSNPVQLTNTPNINEVLPAWSPDGTQIAFSAAQYAPDAVGLEGDIYVINVDGSNQRQITTDPGNDFDPAWSPDGKQIAFVSDRNANNDSNYEIYLINADGTGELRLTNNHSTDRWPTWRASQPEDGAPAACQSALTLLADVTIPPGTRFVQPHDFTKIWRVQNSGTCTWTPTAYSLRSVGVDNLAGPVQMTLPGAIQPGAIVDLAVNLTAPNTPGAYGGVWQVIDPAGQPVSAPDGTPSSMPVSIEVLQPGGNVLPRPLYFLQGGTETPQLWRLEMDGFTRTQVTNEPEAINTYQISRDGHIAYVSGAQLIVMESSGANREILNGVGRPLEVAWSPDGSRVAYSNGGIRVHNIQTGEDTLLIADNDTGMPGMTLHVPLAWSPDGSKILSRVYMWESGELAVISVSDGSVLNELPMDAWAWSLDSQSVYYAGVGSEGMMPAQPGLTRAPASGGTSQSIISNTNVWWPLQAPDGSLYYFMHNAAAPLTSPADNAAQLYRADASGGGATALEVPPLFIQLSDAFNVGWSPDAHSFVAQIVRPAMDMSEVLFFPLDGNHTPPLFLMREIGPFNWGP
ncbi:MAG TPA: NBR1-Ig-like domain-containing protein, partial [Anaerolineales bacterium]